MGSTPNPKAATFSRETDRCHLEVSCNSRRSLRHHLEFGNPILWHELLSAFLTEIHV